MAKKLSDDKLSAILSNAISDSEHFLDGQLSTEREEVEQYYLGELPKPMHKGDSKYVSRDVFDTVDSMRSTVLESFLASSRIVMFRPENGESVDDAKQATEYCRHTFFKKNEGEDLMYDALTEGLMKRYVLAKVYFDETKELDEYEFDGLTMDELTATVSEYDNYEFADTDTDDNGLLSGTFTVESSTGGIKIELVQPEDVMVSSKASSLQEANYIIHRVTKTHSDLLKEGFDESLIDELTFGEESSIFDYEKQKRFSEVGDIISTDSAVDDAGREINVYEVYIRLDRDGEGVTKLWKFVFAQGVILDEERISRYPFTSFVPLPRPHTYFGENFAKSVIPIQNARTVLFRQIINHTLMTNNPRTQVLNGTVQNPNELLDNRMGGIVNVRRMDGLAPIPQAPLNPFAFNLIQMLDEDKEEVTGISKLSQGMNKDAISTQNAEGMVENLISASQQRQKIIARRFGKFIRDTFLLIYQTAADFIEEDEYVAVTGTFVPVNPAEWKERTAASVELTLGYGEAQRDAQKWAEIDMRFSQDPTLAPAYTYEKRYEVLTRGLEKMGIEDLASILTPPNEMQPPEPSPAEQLQMQQMQAQIAMTNAQAQATVMKAQTDQMKAQAELMKAQTDAGFKQATTALDAERLATERFVGMQELELAAKAETQTASYNPDI